MSRPLLRKILADPNVKATLRLVFGWIFIVLGVAGLFLPVLQGLLFIAIGIALLAHHIPLFARIRNAAYRRFPKLQRLVRRARARIRLAHIRATRNHRSTEGS